MSKIAIGLDFGTSSVRALLVDAASGEEIAESVSEYEVITDRDDSYCARQRPGDYIRGLDDVMADLRGRYSGNDVIGIGVDATASTPLPLDRRMTPLGSKEEFLNNRNAMAWLWKDHTAHREARELVSIISEGGVPFLQAYGGVYSPEWFWSKIWHCETEAPEVAAAAATWTELCDYIPAVLTGISDVSELKRGSCGAGYKGMFNMEHGGFPPEDFFARISPGLAAVRRSLPQRVYAPGVKIGTLTRELRERWGLGGEIAVSAGIIDAHSGAIGCGIRPGALVKIIGTSSCDMTLLPEGTGITAIKGISGIVKDGIIPGCYGIEAGQAAVGDVMNWYVRTLKRLDETRSEEAIHDFLTVGARTMRAGTSGLLSLDWHNGNRNVLMDPQLSGLIAGCTLQTGPEEVYRSLIEATGFGARMIVERLRGHGVDIDALICSGGIAVKNDLFMQIYADILESPVRIARTAQASALGAAICASVAAGSSSGGYDTFSDAIMRMTGIKEKTYLPDRDESAAYDELFGLYRRLHDAFGTGMYEGNLRDVMKDLIRIKERSVARTKGERRLAY